MKMEGVICEEEQEEEEEQEYRVKECEKMSVKLIIDTQVKTGRFQLKVSNHVFVICGMLENRIILEHVSGVRAQYSIYILATISFNIHVNRI